MQTLLGVRHWPGTERLRGLPYIPSLASNLCSLWGEGGGGGCSQRMKFLKTSLKGYCIKGTKNSLMAVIELAMR